VILVSSLAWLWVLLHKRNDYAHKTSKNPPSYIHFVHKCYVKVTKGYEAVKKVLTYNWYDSARDYHKYSLWLHDILKGKQVHYASFILSMVWLYSLSYMKKI
jgi:hypothetical protein